MCVCSVCGVLRRDSVDSLLLFFFSPVLIFFKLEPSIKKKDQNLRQYTTFMTFIKPNNIKKKPIRLSMIGIGCLNRVYSSSHIALNSLMMITFIIANHPRRHSHNETNLLQSESCNISCNTAHAFSCLGLRKALRSNFDKGWRVPPNFPPV